MKSRLLAAAVLSVLLAPSAVPAFHETNIRDSVGSNISQRESSYVAGRRIEGVISAMDLASADPWLRVKDANGREKTILMNRHTSEVWKDTYPAEWSELKEGRQVRVRFSNVGSSHVAHVVEPLD